MRKPSAAQNRKNCRSADRRRETVRGDSPRLQQAGQIAAQIGLAGFFQAAVQGCLCVFQVAAVGRNRVGGRSALDHQGLEKGIEGAYAHCAAVSTRHSNA